LRDNLNGFLFHILWSG